METDIKEKRFDSEWVNLIIEAKTIGLTIEEVRIFLSESIEDADSK